jgi:heterodisulfide reductase subunit B
MNDRGEFSAMKYAYFPGCSLHSTGKEYDISLRAVAPSFDLELEEVKEWICCGTSSAHVTDRVMAAAIPMYNLGLVQKSGRKEVVVPCAACFSRFKHALHEVRHSADVAAAVERVLVDKPASEVNPIHPLQIIGRLVSRKDFRKSVARDLSKLKVACYYGCLLTRPPKEMEFPDDPEYPRLMDRLVEKCGAQVIDWSYKTDCCGASFSLTLTDVVHQLTGKILANARAMGANCLCVACSLCHANLDARQPEILAALGESFQLPVFYFTQIVGLALGLEPRRLGLGKHIVSPFELLNEAGVLKK